MGLAGRAACSHPHHTAWAQPSGLRPPSPSPGAAQPRSSSGEAGSTSHPHPPGCSPAPLHGLGPALGQPAPPPAPHRVHIEEERVLLPAGVQAFHSIHQAWVSIVEVRVGDEHWCIWMRTETT